MSCAGYFNFSRCQYFKLGTRLWALKVLSKNSFYKIFNQMMRPMSAFNYCSVNWTNDLNDEEDNKHVLELISLPFSSYAMKYLKDFQQQQLLKQKNKSQQNLFAYQEGLTGLNQQNKDDQGAFTYLRNKKSFVHSLQLINNPMAMDEFKLEDVNTVASEYDVGDCGSFISESVVMSSFNSLEDSSTDDSVF